MKKHKEAQEVCLEGDLSELDLNQQCPDTVYHSDNEDDPNALQPDQPVGSYSDG